MRKTKKIFNLLLASSLSVTPFIITDKPTSNYKVSDTVDAEEATVYDYYFNNWVDNGHGTLESSEASSKVTGKMYIDYEGSKLTKLRFDDILMTEVSTGQTIEIDTSGISSKFTIIGNQFMNYVISKETDKSDFLYGHIRSFIMCNSILSIEGAGLEPKLSWFYEDLAQPDEIIETKIYGAFINLELSNLVLSKNLSEIGQLAFNTIQGNLEVSVDPSNFITIELPDSLKKIDSLAFQTCVYLNLVGLENTHLETIPSYLLGSQTSVVIFDYDKEKKTSIISLPETLKSIDDFGLLAWNFSILAFPGVTSKIILPNSLTYIGAFAFYGSFFGDNIIIPDSVTKIGYGCFKSCLNLKNIIFNKSEESTDIEISDTTNKFILKIVEETEKRGDLTNKYVFDTKTPETGSYDIKILFNDNETAKKYQGYVDNNQNGWGTEITGISADNRITIEVNPDPLPPIPEPDQPNNNNKWIWIGLGIAAALVLVIIMAIIITKVSKRNKKAITNQM